MNHYIKISFFLSVLSFLVSCNGSDNEKPNKVNLAFLKEGTVYNYSVDDAIFTGTIKSVVETQLGQDTFMVRNYSDEITSVYPTQYWVLNDDNFYTSFRLRDHDAYQIACKFNKPVGTSWNVKIGATNYTYSIDALNVNIKTVSQGEVKDAIKIKIQSAATTLYEYISPTVGPLGNGSADDASTTMKLVDYTIGTASSTTVHVPPISYGSFPFLKVNNYWTYNQTSIFSDDVQVKIEVVSKDASNVYKVKMTIGTDPSTYSYWYEDRGLLMVYEDGESVDNADPVYMNPSTAKVGYGWTGLTKDNTFFIYKITSLADTQTTTYFGDLSCMGIDVGNGLFTSQTNYWNQDKGNVLQSGLYTSMDIVDSNARKGEMPFIPVIGFMNN